MDRTWREIHLMEESDPRPEKDLERAYAKVESI
jgi:hypothetical protein